MKHQVLAPRIAVLLAAAFVMPLLMAAPEGQAAPKFADGTAVREENSFLIYEIVGGAKVWFVNATEFYALGYTLERVVVVPQAASRRSPTSRLTAHWCGNARALPSS